MPTDRSAAGPEGRLDIVIPARGGSKEVPRKNLRRVAGKPLLVWSIEAALASARAGRVVVSTDCPEIAKLAVDAGAEVPFLRPESLAGDAVHPVDAVIHYADACRDLPGGEPLAVLMTLPTSPFKTGADFDRMYGILLADPACESVVAVFRDDRLLRGARRAGPDGYLTLAAAAGSTPGPHARRQEVEPLLIVNGCGYAARSADLRRTRSYIAGSVRARPYPMSKLSAIDVDTEEDLRIAELLLRGAGAEERGEVPTCSKT